MNNTNIFFSKENDTFIKINRLLKLHSIETYLQYKKRIIEAWETEPFLFVSYENFKYGIFNNNLLFDEIFSNEIQNLLQIKFEQMTQREYLMKNFAIFYNLLDNFILNYKSQIKINMPVYYSLLTRHPIRWINSLTQELQYTKSIDFLKKEWTRTILMYHFCKINKHEQH